MRCRRFVAVLITALVASSPCFAKTLSYKFKTTDDAAGFKTYGANWIVKSKAYGPAPASCCGTAALLKKKFGTVGAEAVVASLSDGRFAGVLIRTKQQGLKISGYAAIITDEGFGIGAIIRRYDAFGLTPGGGGSTTDICQHLLTDGKTKIGTIELAAKDKKITLYLGGKKVCDAKDDNYAEGVVGLFASQRSDPSDEPTVSYSQFNVHY